MKRTSLTTLREEMRAVARGEREPSPRPAGQLLAALSPEGLELLSVMLREHPATITDVVRLTGRAQPNVSRSLQQLAGHGLVRLTRNGREVRPEPLVRELRVDLLNGTYETEPAEGMLE
jgi:predicted transcriptional regulator